MIISIDVDGLIQTPSTLNETTGELFYNSEDIEIPLNEYDEHYFESEDGEIHYIVCSICLNFIKKTEICMNDCNN